MTALLRMSDGASIPLDLDRWRTEPSAADLGVLQRAVGPVLDVGCGPGRLVEALAARGVPALGIDSSPAIVDEARRRQIPVLLRSVWEPLPATGRWVTALLLDGNVGIGGDPGSLLRRMAALLRPGGRLLVEVEAEGALSGAATARLELDDVTGPWFPWARLRTTDVAELARSGGFSVTEQWEEDGRHFADLRRR